MVSGLRRSIFLRRSESMRVKSINVIKMWNHITKISNNRRRVKFEVRNSMKKPRICSGKKSKPPKLIFTISSPFLNQWNTSKISWDAQNAVSWNEHLRKNRKDQLYAKNVVYRKPHTRSEKSSNLSQWKITSRERIHLMTKKAKERMNKVTIKLKK